MRAPQTPDYVNRAGYEFINGLPVRSPIQAIEAGYRTLEEWCALLAELRPKFNPNLSRSDDGKRDRVLKRLQAGPATMSELVRVSGMSRAGVQLVIKQNRVLKLQRTHNDCVYVLDDAEEAA